MLFYGFFFVGTSCSLDLGTIHSLRRHHHLVLSIGLPPAVLAVVGAVQHRAGELVRQAGLLELDAVCAGGRRPLHHLQSCGQVALSEIARSLQYVP